MCVCVYVCVCVLQAPVVESTPVVVSAEPVCETSLRVVFTTPHYMSTCYLSSCVVVSASGFSYLVMIEAAIFAARPVLLLITQRGCDVCVGIR